MSQQARMVVMFLCAGVYVAMALVLLGAETTVFFHAKPFDPKDVDSFNALLFWPLLAGACLPLPGLIAPEEGWYDRKAIEHTAQPHLLVLSIVATVAVTWIWIDVFGDFDVRKAVLPFASGFWTLSCLVRLLVTRFKLVRQNDGTATES